VCGAIRGIPRFLSPRFHTAHTINVVTNPEELNIQGQTEKGGNKLAPFDLVKKKANHAIT
jgi:hypothetical protein